MNPAPASRPPIGRVPLRDVADSCGIGSQFTNAGPLSSPRPKPIILMPTRAAACASTPAAAAAASCPHARAGQCTPVARAGHGIDETDTHILRVLQADARISNLKLAATVGVLPRAARERVKRLTREGYILGYEAVLNPFRLSAGVLVFTRVRLVHTGIGAANAFKAAVQVRPEILECHEVAGDFDYLIKTRASGIDTYHTMLASLIWALPGVRDTRTFAVMEEVKNTAQLPV